MEIANIDWLEYLFWLKAAEPDKFNSMLPDTNCWLKLDTVYKDFVEYYLRHPVYESYPVVGVSYSQAVAYCQWRTDRVNEKLAIDKGEATVTGVPNDMSKIKKRLLYRLPTKDEWEYGASAGLDTMQYPLGYVKLINNKTAVANIRGFGGPHFSIGDVWYYTPRMRGEGLPNSFGYIEMLGNVKEMVADSLIKGLSYREFIKTDNKSYKISQTTPYTQPDARIGFRCIAEVLE
ncbi:MAG: SUMF1/EgtB/PvdO family nonheme iron enzyme [Sphingobacteriales bacterium JAD_PAG50586_3]|nr:MAG: SUMF1/EgtB/PvdO family nonheme iron enzyme [Sphingobacteriales bacterium JAD_PAG50586_3]